MGAEHHFANWSVEQLEIWKTKAQESELFSKYLIANTKFVGDAFIPDSGNSFPAEERAGSSTIRNKGFVNQPASPLINDEDTLLDGEFGKLALDMEEQEEQAAQNFLTQVKSLFAPFNYRIWDLQQIKEINEVLFNALRINPLQLKQELFLPIAVPLHKDFGERIKKINFQVIHLHSELVEDSELVKSCGTAQFDKQNFFGPGLCLSQIVHVEIDERIVKREIRKRIFLVRKNYEDAQNHGDFKSYLDVKTFLDDSIKLDDRIWRCPVKIARALYYAPLTQLNNMDFDEQTFSSEIEQRLELTKQGPEIAGQPLTQVGWLLDSFYLQTQPSKPKELITKVKPINNNSLTNFLASAHEDQQIYFSPSQVEQFAQLTADFNPLHLEIGFCQQHGLDKPVVHGLLLAALVNKIFQECWPREYMQGNCGQWSFLRPVQVGEGFWVRRKNGSTIASTCGDNADGSELMQLGNFQLAKLKTEHSDLGNLTNSLGAESKESVALEVWTTQGLAMTMIRCRYDLRNSH